MKRQQLEHQQQAALIKWVRLNESIEPRLKLLYAIPNGRKRSIAEAAKLKREGVRAGVPDLCLPVPVQYADGACGVLFLEFKSPSGRTSKEQVAFAQDLGKVGNAVILCRDWMDAARTIVRWLHPTKLRMP